MPTSREVSFSGKEGFRLNGTLLLPDSGSGKRPGIVLLPGSGPPDRDGNIPPFMISNLLKQIAERLAEEGIVSLRFDKRSVRTYAASWPKDTAQLSHFFRWEAFVGDALAAYQFLRREPGVDSARVYLAGHSEGGLITLQIAHDLGSRQDAPAGIVLLATAGRTLDIVIREQLNTQLPRQIEDPALRRRYLDYADKAIAQIKKDKTLPPDMPQELLTVFNPTVTELLYAYFTTDPATLAKAYPGPALILQGQHDIQVSAERDAPRLKAAFQSRPSGNVKLLIVPKASHNLKIVPTRMDPGVNGPVAPLVLDTITRWLKAQTGLKA